MSYQIIVGQATYTVVDDLTDTFQVLLSGQVLSAEWNEPLPGFQINVDRPDIFVKTMAGGFFALAGHVNQLFPQLDSTAYAFDVSASAANTVGQTVTIAVPMGSTFPLAEQNFSLNYVPLRVQGRVTLAATGAPVANAAVTIDLPNALTLRSVSQFEHAAGTPVRSGSLSPSGAGRAVAQTAPLAALTLQLDNTAGLAPGFILRLGAPAAFLFVVIDSVGPEPGVVNLRTPVTRTVTAGEPAQRVTFTPDGNSQPLAEAIPAGLGLLPLGGSLAAGAVQIDDASPARVEYHAVGALADSQGYYRLDGIGRRRSISLRALNPPPPATPTHQAVQGWLVNPRQPVNIVDLPLTPI